MPHLLAQFRAAVFVIAILLLAACAPRVFNADGHVQHTAGVYNKYLVGPIRTRVSAAEYMAFLRKTQPELFSQGFLNESNPALVARLQQWIHAIHTKALTASEQNDIPEPQIVVSNHNYEDGYATSVTNCVDLPVQVTEAKGKPDESAFVIFHFRPEPGISLLRSTNQAERDAPCFRNHGKNTEELKKFIAYYKSLALPDDCQMSLVSGSLTFGRGCVADLDDDDSPSGNRLMFPTIPSVIVLTSQMLMVAPSEESLAGVLAHEMSHYYLLHVARPVERSSFLFRQGNNLNVNFTPDKSPEAAELMKTLSDIGSATMLRQIPNQKLNRQFLVEQIFTLSDSLAQKAISICEKKAQKCGNACADLKGRLAGPNRWLMSAKRPLSAEQQQFYLGTESALLSCAQNSSVGFLPFVNDFTTWQLKMRVKFSNRISGIGKAEWKKIRKARTLSEYLLLFSSAANDTYKRLDSFFTAWNGKNFGWYTFEQEADDTALELLSLIGVEPKELSSFMQKWLWEDPDLMNNWTSQKCTSAFESGYRNAQGVVEIPPFGLPSDPHHTACYRVFNIYREILNHKYAIDPSGKPQFTEPWAAMVKQIPR